MLVLLFLSLNVRVSVQVFRAPGATEVMSKVVNKVVNNSERVSENKQAIPDPVRPPQQVL